MSDPTAAAPPLPPGARPRGARMRRAVLVTATVLVLFYLGMGALIAVFLTKPKRRFEPGHDPGTARLAYKDVRFPARGGDVELTSWYVPQEPRRAAVVMVHGFGSSRAREYGGHGAQVAAALHQRGFGVLMLDLRGHGESGEARVSFGTHEQRDVLGAVDYLRAEGYPRIGLIGVSMGGASSLLAAAADPGIGAVVEDSSYADVAPIVTANFQRVTRLPGAFIYPTRLWGRLLFGADPAAARPVDEIARIAPRPVLIIHSRADRLIPYPHAEQLKAARPDAEMWTLDAAPHAGAYSSDPAGYIERVGSFFGRTLLAGDQATPAPPAPAPAPSTPP